MMAKNTGRGSRARSMAELGDSLWMKDGGSTGRFLEAKASGEMIDRHMYGVRVARGSREYQVNMLNVALVRLGRMIVAFVERILDRLVR